MINIIKNKMTKALMLLFALTFIMTFPTQALRAEELGSTEVGTENVSPENYQAGSYDVVDDAGLLSTQDAEDVRAALADLAQKTGWSVFAITTDDARGMTSQQYADDFIDTHAFEQDGVCYLIDMDNREAYICTTGIAIRYMTDDRIDRATERGASYCGDGNYRSCFLEMISCTSSYYDQGIYADQYNQDVENGHYGERDYYNEDYGKKKLLDWGEILIAVVAFIATILIIHGVVIGQYQLNMGRYQYDYRKYSRLNLRQKEDILVDTHVTHHRVSSSSGSSSHSSGHRSSTHHSSGGGHHGGGGHHF